MRIAVVGTGRMGSALRDAFAVAGYPVLSAVRATAGPLGLAVNLAPASGDAGVAAVVSTVRHCRIDDAIGAADVVFLAVPIRVALAIADERARALNGRTVVDVTNPAFDRDGALPPGHRSAGEALAAALPGSAVTKAFNTVPAAHLTSPRIAAAGGTLPVCLPIAGDDPHAKAVTAGLADRLGFRPLDAGGITASRELEALAALLHHLGRHQNWGTGIGFHAGRLP